jgi:16S rRNA U516 pseudouridylate synthase RsuA-like enzyme
MRHQTTAYDNLKIARIKGRRREVRRELAEVSRAVLDLHRGTAPHATDGCPLCFALARAPVVGKAGPLAEEARGV